MKRTLEFLRYLRPLTGIQRAMYGDSASVVIIPLYAALVASRIMKMKAIHLKTGDLVPLSCIDVTLILYVCSRYRSSITTALFLILRNYEK